MQGEERASILLSLCVFVCVCVCVSVCLSVCVYVRVRPFVVARVLKPNTVAG
jgi:hypothetical protein